MKQFGLLILLFTCFFAFAQNKKWNPDGDNFSLGTLTIGDFTDSSRYDLDGYQFRLNGGALLRSNSRPVFTISWDSPNRNRRRWLDIAIAVSNRSFSRLAKKGDLVFRGAGKDMIFSNEAGGDYIFGYGAWENHKEGMRFTKLGNLGIGTTNPTAKLDVNGAIKGSSLQIGNIFYGDEGISLSTEAFQIEAPELVFSAVNGSVEVDTKYTSISSTLFVENNNVGIGTTDTKGYKLAVDGKVISEEVKVQLSGEWQQIPDYVFKEDYNLPTLTEVENHIKEKGHLKNIPSAKEIEKEGGIFIGEMNLKLLEKIEELTLYTIQQEKKLEELENKNQKVEILEVKTKLQDQKIELLLKRLEKLEASK